MGVDHKEYSLDLTLRICPRVPCSVGVVSALHFVRTRAAATPASRVSAVEAVASLPDVQCLIWSDIDVKYSIVASAGTQAQVIGCVGRAPGIWTADIAQVESRAVVRWSNGNSILDGERDAAGHCYLQRACRFVVEDKSANTGASPLSGIWGLC